MVMNGSTATNQTNDIMKRHDSYVATAAEKLRQRLVELQRQQQQNSSSLDVEQKNPFLPDEIRQLKEQLKAQLEQADKNYATMQSKHVANGYQVNEVNGETENVSISTHSREPLWDNKKEINNHVSIESLEKEIAMLRESLAKYQNMHPQSIENRDAISDAKNISERRPQHNILVQPSSPSLYNKLGNSKSDDNDQQINKSHTNEGKRISIENAQMRLLQAQEEYEKALEMFKMASQTNRKTTDCQTIENSLNNRKEFDKLLCPLHEYFSLSSPYILKLESYLQSSGEECSKQMTRLVQHSGVQEIKEMLFFCVDKLIQKDEEQQEEEKEIMRLEQTLERVKMENNEKIQQQQDIENKLRDELEKCQTDLSKAELALDVALSEKLVLENRTPALEFCETLETRLEKLETRRNKHEKELHRQIAEKNQVIEELKRQISTKDKETNRLYAEVQHLLQNVEQLRSAWTRQQRESFHSRKKV
ncbi:uncharacterized protein Gasu_39710 [Galdieria sulphuraria]|uniref:Uncharacterized protein n=1 Tax=Galdieria sulphuraria TaxID=130081 RepID=M2WX49_GALSU|nr:uncharacterized protein Gasu_39710 [Galdieria sulphuraria]EME28595.1 hypothetical protein Gasu_39710 [Galdieria sulphuraria]|eukprot:XP_005705115.1 hypothetical protein Gasu_39710 [Galdieria sulphuraria]